MFNDEVIAVKYLNKVKNARERGIPFELTFYQFKRLINKKYCQYSGLELFDGYASNKDEVFRTRTIERINCSLGYTKENCITVCNGLNQFKSQWENKEHLTFKIVNKMITNINKFNNAKT